MHSVQLTVQMRDGIIGGYRGKKESSSASYEQQNHKRVRTVRSHIHIPLSESLTNLSTSYFC